MLFIMVVGFHIGERSRREMTNKTKPRPEREKTDCSYKKVAGGMELVGMAMAAWKPP